MVEWTGGGGGDRGRRWCMSSPMNLVHSFIRQLGQDLPLRLGQLEGIFSFYRARGHSQQTHIFS